MLLAKFIFKEDIIMIKLINTYKDDSYFYKLKNGKIEKIDIYNPEDKEIKLHFENEDYIFELDSSDIHMDISGNIYFVLNDKKYIIDDGYRNVMIRCGYLFKNNFEQKYSTKDNGGVEVKKSIFKDIYNTLNKIINSNVENEDDKISVIFCQDGYEFKLVFSSVEKLVSTNYDRKINKQPFYPFIKDNDRYGCVFVAIYAKRYISTASEQIKYDDADELLGNIVTNINNISKDNYHYKPLYIKKRVICNNINNI